MMKIRFHKKGDAFDKTSDSAAQGTDVRGSQSVTQILSRLSSYLVI